MGELLIGVIGIGCLFAIKDYNYTKGGVCMEDKKINRAFNEMYIAAKKRLDNKSPIDIANKAGIVFCEETSTLKVKSLDRTVELIYPSHEYKQKLDDWYVLILLHYLDMADGTPVSNQAVNFGELKDGLIRGVKFEKTMELELNRFFFIIDIINVFILKYKRIELQYA